MNKNVLLLSLFSLVFSYDLWYKANIEGKEFTFRTTNLIEEDTKIRVGDNSFLSEDIEDVIFLVVDGAYLDIQAKNLKVVKKCSKSNVDNYFKDKEKDNSGIPTVYKYGVTSSIVAIGQGTKVFVEGATIEIDWPFSDAFVALNGAKITIRNSTIITRSEYSKGIFALNNADILIEQNSTIITIGDYSPCIDVNKGDIYSKENYFHTKGKESPLMRNLRGGEMDISLLKGEAENSQILVKGGNNYIYLDSCELSCFTGNINNENNFNDGGIVLFNNDESDYHIGIVELDECSIKIKNPNISMFYCYNIDFQIMLTYSNIETENIFLKADKTENSTIETIITLSVVEKGIKGKVIAKNNTEIILRGDKNLYNIETEGKVHFEDDQVFTGIGLKNSSSSSSSSKKELKDLLLLNGLIILLFLSFLIIKIKKI